MVGMDLGEACLCLPTAAVLVSNSGLRLTQGKSQTTHASVCAKEWSFPGYHSGCLLRCFFSGCWGVPSQQKGGGLGDLPVSSVALLVVGEFCYYAYYILLTSELAQELRRSWGAGE